LPKISPKQALDYGYFLSLNSSILASNFFGQIFLFRKAPFWAIFGQSFFLQNIQGDQIGRIFALLAIVYFGRFKKNCNSSPHFCAIFPLRIDYVLNLTKIGLGYILGDFFTNSSGHPASHTALNLPFFQLTKKTFLLRSN
jgi:hypothetical protein